MRSGTSARRHRTATLRGLTAPGGTGDDAGEEMAVATIERVSTHVLDTAAGVPAAGVPAVLCRDGADPTDHTEHAVLGRGTTDADGRIAALNDGPLVAGDYRVTLDVADHMRRTHGALFHPTITVHVRLDGARPHYHLPVLASPYSYTTYLGS